MFMFQIKTVALPLDCFNENNFQTLTYTTFFNMKAKLTLL